MQINYRLTVFLVLLSSISAFSQGANDSTRSTRVKYFNTFESGALFAKKEKGTTFTFNTTHGVRINRFRAGVGAGYDTYVRWKCLPIYGTVSYDFLRRRKSNFYVSTRAGLSKAWRIESEFQWITPQVERAIAVYPAVGYRFEADGVALYVSAGYKWQRINYTFSDDFSRRSSVKEELERVVVQLGFGLN